MVVNSHQGQCTICNAITEVRHLPIYVFGSEGIEICHECEMGLVKYVLDKTMEYQRARMRAAVYGEL